MKEAQLVSQEDAQIVSQIDSIQLEIQQLLHLEPLR